MSHITVDKLTLDIPIFDVTRSFRTYLFKSLKSVKVFTGGVIQQSEKKTGISVRALDNVSFSLKDGDRVGIIGHNGAGKTTLLRALGGIYKTAHGQINTSGKVTTLFSQSLGLDMSDTGYDSIASVGMFLGMSKQEIQEKRESIIQFSGLGDFIFLPVKTYSSGMLMRLTFAISTALQPDILLLDEGIGVSDANFTQKANVRLKQFYDRLKILVIATHSDALIKQMCNKALLLEHGKIKMFGQVDEVLSLYHKG